jgi:hypothetical protein
VSDTPIGTPFKETMKLEGSALKSADQTKDRDAVQTSQSGGQDVHVPEMISRAEDPRKHGAVAPNSLIWESLHIYF